MRNSIRTRLSITFIGLAIMPLLLVGIILAWQSFTIEQQQALNLQREVARRVAVEVTAFFEELENVLHLVSKAQALPELDRNEQQNILKLLMAQDVFEDVVLLDNQGQEQIHLARLGLFSVSRNDYAEADEFVVPHASAQIYYSPIRFETTTGEPLITIAVPLLDIRTGLVDGVLVSEIRMKKIWDLIADVRVSPGQRVYIVDAQNTVIAHRNPSVVLRDTRFPLPERDGIQSGLTGENTVLAVETVHFGEQTFHIVAEQIVSEALALAISTVVITGVLIVAALLIAGSLGFLSVRRIVRPIQAMATTAEAISAGDLSQQVSVASQDELGVLATAFNSMTGQLRKIITDLEGQIAERKRAEESLRDTNETLHALFDHSPLAITMIDSEGHVLLWNEAAERIYGWTAQEVLGEFLPIVSNEKRGEYQAIHTRLMKGESLTSLELERQRKDGSPVPLEISIAPLLDTDGNVYAHMSIAADITERKQAELALRESEQKFRAVVQNAQAVIFILDNDGVFLLSEGQELAKLGLAPGQVVGMSAFELYKDYPTVVESVTRASAGESVHVVSVVQDVAFNTVYSPYYNLEGEQIGVIGVAIDITERRRMEEALRKSEERLRLAMEGTADGIWDWDPRTGQAYFSFRYYTMMGYEPDEFPPTYESWRQLLHPDDVETAEKAVQRALEEHSPFAIEFRLKAKNGEWRWILSRGKIAELDAAGKATRMAGFHTDITERKRAEDEIRQLNEELEQRVIDRTAQLEAAQTELLRRERLATLGKLTATVSHEIRNPLATIRASTFSIRRKTQDKGLGVERALDRLERNITRCDDIIGELLDYTRMSEPSLRTVVFDEWLQQFLGEQAFPQEIELVRELAAAVPVTLDPARFQRVMINLLDNACQAMTEQEQTDNLSRIVQIHTTVIDGKVHLSLSDTGPGILPDVLPHIFEPLYSTKGFGVGLGLPIVKEIVQQHHGDIEITSEAGQGAQVTLRLPVLREDNTI
jgi:PAS domain S-box-containing protein